jgi:nucleoid-associated protein YgaU
MILVSLVRIRIIYLPTFDQGGYIMANFFQDIINKITGHGANPNTANIDISHVASAAAAGADPRVEVAQREAAQAAAEKAAAEKAAADAAAAQQTAALSDADKQAAASQADQARQIYLEQLAQAQKEKDQAAAEAAMAISSAADQFEIIKEHTLTDDDTLSGLALHFYGHATPEYWGLIILANKATIGDSVKDYTPRKVIKIPKLPDEMKK